MIRWMPVWVFIGAYSILCVIGSVLLFWHVEPFVGDFERLFGVKIPVMTEKVRVTFLTILFGSPLAFAMGYGIVLRALRGVNVSVDFRDRDIGKSALYAHVVFYALLFWSLWSLYSGGAFSLLSSWGAYKGWVDARWTLFSSLNFFEFANVYMFLPTAAALVVLATKPRSAVEHGMRWLPTLLTLGVDILLYQKKPLVLTLLSSGGALWLSAVLLRPDRVSRHVAIATAWCAGLVTVYFALVLAPYLWSQQTFWNRAYAKSNFTQVAMLSLIMRVPAPALHYPVVFPEQHPFYNLDLGQDILRFGSMPDDNHVVWRVMYPNTAGGASAPFNFVLYSQGGIAVSLIGTAGVGALVALCWLLALSSRRGVNMRSLLGILLLLFVVHLTIDSLRNTAIVSYGFMWGGTFVLIAYLVETALTRAGIIAAPATSSMRRG